MKLISKLATALLLYSSATAAVQVTVDANGKTFEEAKKSAFKTAIERATGVLTISEQEVSGYRMTRDYIGSYSSGWIDQYEIIDAFQDVNGNWVVQLRAEVRDSKIKTHSQRRNTMNAQTVNGAQQSARLGTQTEQRNQGDRLLEVVLRSYPEHAYQVVQGQTNFQVGRSRESYVDIDYDITFSPTWIDSLKDALAAISIDEVQCNTLSMVIANGVATNNGNGTKNLAAKVCGKDPDLRVFSKNGSDWFPRAHNYYLSDDKTLVMLNNHLRATRLSLRIDLLTADNQKVESKCTYIGSERFVFYNEPKGTYNYNQIQNLSRPNFMGQNLLEGTIRYVLSNSSSIENVAQIKLSVQSSC